MLAVERTGEYQRPVPRSARRDLADRRHRARRSIHIPRAARSRSPAESVDEVIVATDADIEGEATAAYLHRVLAPLGVKVTRPAHGLPVRAATSSTRTSSPWPARCPAGGPSKGPPQIGRSGRGILSLRPQPVRSPAFGAPAGRYNIGPLPTAASRALAEGRKPAL